MCRVVWGLLAFELSKISTGGERNPVDTSTYMNVGSRRCSHLPKNSKISPAYSFFGLSGLKECV